MGNIIINLKSFEVYDKRNKLFFAFDYNKAIENFRSIEEVKISYFEFNNFHEIFSGFELLRLCYIDKSDILKCIKKLTNLRYVLINQALLIKLSSTIFGDFLGCKQGKKFFK